MTLFKLAIVKWPEAATRDVDVRATWRSLMSDFLRSVFTPLMEAVKRETEYASIADAYFIEEGTEGGDAVTMALRNSNPIWPFREFNTRAHWAPWGGAKEGEEPTPLFLWATERGIPPFLAARKIARDGTTGNYIVTRQWAQVRPQIKDGVQSHLYEWVRNMGDVRS
jgi:hypothetical protein